MVKLIAEIGANHNQSLDHALALISLASDAGATGVKFQLWHTDMYRPNAMLPYGGPANNFMEQHRLPTHWLQSLVMEAHRCGMIIGFSVFDLHSIVEAKAAGADYLKVAAMEAEDLSLVRMVLNADRETVISIRPEYLSMDHGQYRRHLSLLLSLWGSRVAPVMLLHCISGYPTTAQELRLDYMDELRLLHKSVGLSNHTTNTVAVPVLAVAKGAEMIETHFTDDVTQEGPDHFFALEPDAFRQLVYSVQLAQDALFKGQPNKHSRAEEMTLSYARRRIYTAQPMEEGEVFTGDKITTYRSGYGPALGFPASQMERVVGRRAARALDTNYPVGETELMPLDGLA
jgi:sialic acid synthase SpsE